MAGSFKTELVNAIRNAFCTALQTQQNYYGYVGGTFKWAVTAQLAERFFATAYRLACNREPPAAPTPSFTGGQCFTNYNWNGTIRQVRISSGAVTTTAFSRSGVPGKIGEVVVTSETEAGFPVWRSRIPSTSSTGAVTYTDLGTIRRDIYQQPTWQSITVSRQDGLPDNCGNLPVPVPTPTPGYNTTTTNVTYTNNNNVDVTLSATFIFAKASLNVKGELNVPVRIDLGGVNLQIGGNINLNTGDVNLNFGNPNYSRNGLPNPDCYEPDPSIPDVPDDIPDDVTIPPTNQSQPETTRVLRACIVTASVIPPDISLIFQDGNPTITAPNLGYVSFCISVNGKKSWTSDIPVKNARNFIPCPWDGGAIEVRGTPRQGVSWLITPVYALIEDAVEFA